MAGLMFPNWYYGGPFARVSNPDTDLPVRVDRVVSDAQRERTEQQGVLDGERLVAPFHDGNTVENILGAVLLAMAYPAGWDEDERFLYPTIQGLLANIRDRLVEKTGRLRGPKAARLAKAIPCVQAAAEAYARSEYDAGCAALSEVEKIVVGASKTGRRLRILRLGPGRTEEGRG